MRGGYPGALFCLNCCLAVQIVPVVGSLSQELLDAVLLGITEPHKLCLDRLAAILAYEIEASKPIAGAITALASSLQLQCAEPAAAAPVPCPPADAPLSIAAADASSEDDSLYGDDIFGGACMINVPAITWAHPLECLRSASAAWGGPAPEGPCASAPLRETAALPACDTEGGAHHCSTSSQYASDEEDLFGGVPRNAGSDCAPGSVDDLFGGVPRDAGADCASGSDDDPFGGVSHQPAAAAQSAPPVPGEMSASGLQQAAVAHDVPDASAYICGDVLFSGAPVAQSGFAAMGLFPGLPYALPATGIPCPPVPMGQIPCRPPRAAVACA